jgi:hypothetical protein
LATTVARGQVRHKIIKKIDAKILGKYSSQKIIFLYGEEENIGEYSQKLENIRRVSSRIINYSAQNPDPDPGLRYLKTGYFFINLR